MNQVTESKYNEMLEVLPPEAMNGSSFLVGEPYDHNDKGEPRFHMFAKFNGLYYSVGFKTIAEFNAIDLSKEEIGEPNEETAQELELVEQYSQEAVDAYKRLGLGDLDNFEEAYVGQFASDEEFAQNMAEEIGAIDKNAIWPNNCIDWEFAARELMYDYSTDDGYYFRNL